MSDVPLNPDHINVVQINSVQKHATDEKLPSVREIIQKENKIMRDFKKFPLKGILTQINKHHIGTIREQKTALTGFMYIMRVLAKKDKSGILKITGKSSAGKSHLANTLLSFFPQNWIKEVGDLSEKALHYIDWNEEKILYIKEGSGSERSTETLKLMDSGDGGFKALVTRGDVANGFHAEEIEIPVKFIITTSAKDMFDVELDNRMFGISIDESEEQTSLILDHRCKYYAGHITDELSNYAQKFIRELKRFDKIVIPFSYEFKTIIYKKIRARRDIDKLLSLCQTSAFIHQYVRPVYEEEGKRILFATPQDAYNIFTLAFSSFNETITGLSKRMEHVYYCIPEDPNGITYRQLMKKAGFDYKEQVKREVDKLENRGLVDIDTTMIPHMISRVDDIEKMQNNFDKHKMNLLAYTIAELSQFFESIDIPLSWCDINREIDNSTKINNLKGRNKECNNPETTLLKFYDQDEIEAFFGSNKVVKIIDPCFRDVSVDVSPVFSKVTGFSLNIKNNRNTETKTKDKHTKATNQCIINLSSCSSVSPTKEVDLF